MTESVKACLGTYGRDTVRLCESVGEVMNISVSFTDSQCDSQTHLNGFTLYIPPHLLCPATPGSKKKKMGLCNR